MPILEKCAKCKREGGYVSDASGKICERCVRKAGASAGNDENKTDKK